MTIAFALRAIDGVVVVADGRTTSRPTRLQPLPEAKTDWAVKLVRAPYGLPWVVATSGRASIGGPAREISMLVTETLESVPEAELAGMTLGEVVSRLREGLDERARLVPATFEDGTSDPVHVLAAGFAPGAGVEVWKSIGRRPGDVERSDAGATFCGIVDDRADGESAEDRVLVLFDGEFDARCHDPDYRVDGDYYLLREMSLVEVVELAKDRLIADVKENADTYAEDGIGGVWLFASVDADDVWFENVPIGPMMATDAPGSGAAPLS